MSERLILWDIDGTLVNTAGHGRDAFAEAFEAAFGRAPRDDGVVMAGRTDPDIARELLLRDGIGDGGGRVAELLAALVAALGTRAAAIAEEGHPMPGVHGAIEALGREGFLQGVLTGNVRPNAELKLAAFGLDRLLDLAIGGYGSDHELRSELVAVARGRAAALHGFSGSPERTVLIGDTPRDVAAAHAGGARAIAVATGPYSADELVAAGADAVLGDVSDARALVRAVSAT